MEPIDNATMRILHNGSATLTLAGRDVAITATIYLDTSRLHYDWTGKVRGDQQMLWEACEGPGGPHPIRFGTMSGTCLLVSPGGTPPNGVANLLGTGEIEGLNLTR